MHLTSLLQFEADASVAPFMDRPGVADAVSQGLGELGGSTIVPSQGQITSRPSQANASEATGFYGEGDSAGGKGSCEGFPIRSQGQLTSQWSLHVPNSNSLVSQGSNGFGQVVGSVSVASPGCTFLSGVVGGCGSPEWAAVPKVFPFANILIDGAYSIQASLKYPEKWSLRPP